MAALMWLLYVAIWSAVSSAQSTMARDRDRDMISFTTTEAYGVVLGALNTTNQKLFGIDMYVDVTVQDMAGNAMRAAKSQYLLLVRVCPAAVFEQLSLGSTRDGLVDKPAVPVTYFRDDFCRIISPSTYDVNGCVSVGLSRQDDNGLYRAVAAVESTLDFSNDAADVFYIVLDACRLLNPQAAPTLVGSFRIDVCTDCVTWYDDNNATYSGIFAVIWSIASVVWLLHIRKHANEYPFLQKQMAFVPLTELMYITACVWRTPGAGFATNLVISGCHCIALFSASYTMLVLAYGWRITRMDIPAALRFQFRSLSASYSLVVVSILDDHIYTMLGFLVWGFLSATLIYLMWSHTRNNISMLHVQASVLRAVSVEAFNSIVIKLHNFQTLRRALLLYFLGECTGQVVLEQWVGIQFLSVRLLYYESLYFLLCATIGYTFQYRPVPVSLMGHQGSLRKNLSLVCRRHLIAGNALVQVSPTIIQAPPPIATTAPRPSKPPMVVIVSPNSQANLGKPATGNST